MSIQQIKKHFLRWNQKTPKHIPYFTRHKKEKSAPDQEDAHPHTRVAFEIADRLAGTTIAYQLNHDHLPVHVHLFYMSVHSVRERGCRTAIHHHHSRCDSGEMPAGSSNGRDGRVADRN